MSEATIPLRDWFAGMCPDSWLAIVAPKTIGDVRDALILRGIIPTSRAKGDVLRSYTNSEHARLLTLLRYDYADAMLEASE